MVKYKRGQLLKFEEIDLSSNNQPEQLMIKNISLINNLHPDYLLIVDNSNNDFCEILLIFKRHNHKHKKNSNKSNIKLNKRRKKRINHLKGVKKSMTVSSDNYLEEREKSQKIYKSKMYYALKYPYQGGSMK